MAKANVSGVESSFRSRRTVVAKRGLWNRLPAAVKIILTLPVVMALLGAEVELRLAPQLDLVLTVAGVCAMWAWLSGGPSAA